MFFTSANDGGLAPLKTLGRSRQARRKMVMDAIGHGTEARTMIKRAMVDIVSPEKRSAMMAAVRTKNTRPELIVRRILHREGLRYRLHRSDLPGAPDLVFPKRRTVIFVHGCFWHGHDGCRYATVPKTRREFWIAKIDANRARDARAVEALRKDGWNVIVVWECETRRPDELRQGLLARLRQSRARSELPVSDWLMQRIPGRRITGSART